MTYYAELGDDSKKFFLVKRKKAGKLRELAE